MSRAKLDRNSPTYVALTGIEHRFDAIYGDYLKLRIKYKAGTYEVYYAISDYVKFQQSESSVKCVAFVEQELKKAGIKYRKGSVGWWIDPDQDTFIANASRAAARSIVNSINGMWLTSYQLKTSLDTPHLQERIATVIKELLN